MEGWGGQLMLIRVPLDSVTQILLHQMYFSSPVGSFNLHAALPARGEPLSLSLSRSLPPLLNQLRRATRQWHEGARWHLSGSFLRVLNE